MKTSQNTRNQTIDSCRAIAIFFVIAIHARPFSGTSGYYLEVADVLINQIARFAVPLFFVISGYLWSKKSCGSVTSTSDTFYSMKRLIILFIFWCGIYLLPTDLFKLFEVGMIETAGQLYRRAIYLVQNPSILLLQGTREHLWFFIALASCTMITWLILKYSSSGTLYIVSITLFIIANLGNAYSETAIGISSSFNFRNGPFFGLLFFATGHFLATAKRLQISKKFIISIIIAAIFLQYLEISVLHNTYGESLYQEFVFSTYLLGLGTALLALNPNKSTKPGYVSDAGRLTLGVYVLHPIVLDYTRYLDLLFDSVWWELSFVPLTFIITLALVKLASTNNSLRKLVQ